MRKFVYLLLPFFCLLAACSSKSAQLKVAASSVPHAEILESVKEDMKKDGVDLKIVEVDDYNLPNRLVYEKQVDANFFQHKLFLDSQNANFGYNLVPLVSVHIEPMGIYSLKIDSLEDLTDGASVAIPSDPTNEARALLLLQQEGLIKLKNVPFPSVLDIEENSKNLSIKEVDAPFLPRSLPDVTLAVIPANFALQANLSPSEALVTEGTGSPYANLVAVRKGEEDRPEFLLLAKHLRSEKTRDFIISRYEGTLQPIVN